MCKVKCPKCGNDKFYTECSIPAKIEYNPNTGQYGRVFDIDKSQTNSFESVYCTKCEEEIDA
ncbi:MAG: hypothetical protein NSGCLCUN01_04029 [uncultured Clostridium sp.]